MKRCNNYFLVSMYLILFCVSALFGQDSRDTLSGNNNVRADQSVDNSNVQLVYQCQVHPQVISNAAGPCPRCQLQLKALSIEAAFANLNKKGYKKPELSLNYLTKTVVEEEVAIDDSAEVSDTTGFKPNPDILTEYDFEAIDHDQDGWLYQCPKHPLEFEDESGKCLVCGTPYEARTVDEVKTKLVNMRPAKEPEEGEEETTAANNP